MARAAKLYLSLALLFIANLSIARAQVVGGSISGGVHDASGATLSGATVTVRQIETGATRTLTTDREGRFFAPSVPVGGYTVSVKQDGFETQQQTGITLTIGQTLQLNFVLGVATVQQQVVVDASEVSVNTTTQQTAEMCIRDRVPLNRCPWNRSTEESLSAIPSRNQFVSRQP